MDSVKELQSLEQYIVVELEEVLLDRFTRQKNGDWLLRSFKKLDQKALLGECEVLLEEIYGKVISV
ncbi:MAG: hypothetical protein AAF740_11185 [Bacteroidota bacterium]